MTDQALLDAIKPKSDQLNADDLIGNDLTITITKITVAEGGEQRVAIYFAEGEGNKKPWKPCKGMTRVLVAAWGSDLAKWKGQRVKLFRDETVLWAGAAVGGIRIRALSGIASDKTFVVTQSKKSKVPMKVQRLDDAPKTKAADKAKDAPKPEPETPFDGDQAPAEPPKPTKPTTLAEALEQMPLTSATAMGSFCSSLEGGPIDIVALRMGVKAFVLSKKDDTTSPIERLAEAERAPAIKALKEGAAANVGWCKHLVGLWLT